MCIILSGSLRDWWNVNVRTIIPITESENIDVCSVLTQCLPGVEVPSQYISMHLSLPIPPHYFFFLLMNKILKCGVCFQKRGMKNYCVDTWLVSLPPTLALSDNTPGCPSPFEMLMGFLNVLLQNSPPPPSFLHPLRKFSLPAALSVCSLSSWLSASFSASSCLFFGSLETAVCYNICLSGFF